MDARCYGYEIVEDAPHPPEKKKKGKELTRFFDFLCSSICAICFNLLEQKALFRVKCDGDTSSISQTTHRGIDEQSKTP
ncbi:hypothetical protein CEXT_246451 [Caerostris extrusa]|uniref:Uncharacterized protein n=1 Tax=Caerostris extrusa TaxID=172846 RepID=A0AAV4XE53_CAEEX|nr:hypothetical protein CEXT_246451 [Caerostris extrusa]